MVVLNVGAVTSSTYAWLPVLAPVLPAASVSLNTMLLLPDSAAPSQLIVLSDTLEVMAVQLDPLFVEPKRVSPVASAADRVAVIVCAAVLVMKSVFKPESVLMSTELTV